MSDAIQKLEKDLLRLRSDFHERAKGIELEIARLKQEITPEIDLEEGLLENVSIKDPFKDKPEGENLKRSKMADQIPGPADNSDYDLDIDLNDNLDTSLKGKLDTCQEDTLLTETPGYKKTGLLKNNLEDSGSELKKKRRMSLSFLWAAIAEIITPLGALTDTVTSAYSHYKSQGKATAFLMTTCGIIALIFGFGYLLQYAFSNFLGITARVAAGFLGASAVSGLGGFISVKKQDMKDFGAGLIGLGIILNFLCVYVAGPLYGIFSPITGLSILALISFAAVFLAVAFETRVVSVVTLFGGALLPMFSEIGVRMPNVYLAYLLILCTGLLFVAEKIKWNTLKTLIISTSIVMCEYCLFSESFSHSLIAVLILHGYFFLFGYSILMEGKRLKRDLSGHDLAACAASVIFLVVSVFQASGETVHAGTAYIMDSVITGGLFYLLQKKSHPAASMLLLVAGALAGSGVLALSSPNLLGAILGLEGILLVSLGFVYAYPQVRREGYFIIIAAILQISYLIFEFLSSFPDLYVNAEWFGMPALGILLFLSCQVQKRVGNNYQKQDLIVALVSGELLSFWISLFFFSTTYMIMGPECLLLTPVPMFYLMYRSSKEKLHLTEFLGFSHYLLILFQVGMAASDVGHFHFFSQSITGKLAQAEAFLSLWVFQEFYKRYVPEGRLILFSGKLRILFYLLIPVCFLPSVNRHFPEYFIFAAWGSVVLALILFRTLKHKALSLELDIIASLASLLTFAQCLWGFVMHKPFYGFPELLTGAFFFSLTAFLLKALAEKKYQKGEPLSFLFHLAFFYGGISIMLLAYAAMGIGTMAFLSGALYFLYCSWRYPVIAPLRRTYAIYNILGQLFVVTVICLCFEKPGVDGLFAPLMAAAAVGWLGFVIHKRPPHGRVLNKISGGSYFRLSFFHIQVLAVLALIAANWFGDISGPAMTLLMILHATAVLFLNLKPAYKGMVFISVVIFACAALKLFLHDLSGFSMIQKTVAFIGTGIILLGASYKYQSMKQ